MEKQEMEMKWKLETEMGTNNTPFTDGNGWDWGSVLHLGAYKVGPG